MYKINKIFVNRIAVLVLVVALLSFTGCSTSRGDFDISGYITAVLDSTYKASDAQYIKFTGATQEEASKNGDTTFSNATIRFFQKYKLNASDTQTVKLASVFEKAYSLCQYTVGDKVETATGYSVTVQYSPMTTIKDLSSRIESMKEEAGDSAYDVGAEYIDKIIDLCSNSLESSGYGDSVNQIIDIKLAESGELSLNVKLFEKIDEEMLPF